jgi:hypothetical protein
VAAMRPRTITRVTGHGAAHQVEGEGLGGQCVRDRPPRLRMVAVELHGKDLPGEFVVTVPLLRQAVQGPGPPPES